MSADGLQLFSTESVSDRCHDYCIRITGLIQFSSFIHPALVTAAEDDDDVTVFRLIAVVMVKAVGNEDAEHRDEKQQDDDVKFTVHPLPPSACRFYSSY